MLISSGWEMKFNQSINLSLSLSLTVAFVLHIITSTADVNIFILKQCKLCVRVYVCVGGVGLGGGGACVRACERACVRECVRARARACVRVSVWEERQKLYLRSTQFTTS